MNKWIGMGNIGKDVDVRTNGDSTVARFSLAVKRKFAKEGDIDTDWISVVCFGKLATFAEKYLHKGSKIVVEARVQTGSYTNKDGVKVYTTDFIAENIEFAESKKEAEQNKAEEKPETKEDDGFMNVEDTDDMELPFA